MAIKHRGNIKPRSKALRNSNPVCLFVCEGNNVTESRYFNDYGKTISNVKFKFLSSNETDPVNLVEHTIKLSSYLNLSSEKNDSVFVLIDGDVSKIQENKIKHAKKIINDSNINVDIKIIVSNPCFEIWFLMHHSCGFHKYNNSRDVIYDLRRIYPKYTKSTEDMFETLKDKTYKAIECAKKQEKFLLNAEVSLHSKDFEPSSEVYKIIETIQNRYIDK